jgi:hypothetical protein
VCCFLNVTRMIKLRRMNWAGHIARMGEMISGYSIWVGKPEEKKSLGRY